MKDSQFTHEFIFREQIELRGKLILHNDFPWFWSNSSVVRIATVSLTNLKGQPLTNLSVKGVGPDGPLKYVAGVDISFVKDNDEDAAACLVVLEIPSLKVIPPSMVSVSGNYSQTLIKILFLRFCTRM